MLSDFRRAVSDALASHCPEDRQGALQACLRRQSECTLHVPVEIGDYTDFFAGIHHATATGSLLKPEDPLPRTYKWVPMAYHARSSSVIASGADIHRPLGQRGSRGGMPPRFEPTARLDFELELGFYIGIGNALGAPIGIQDAGRHIAGFCLLNDWSARDMQRWELVPLGPFLSKNFATTISPWIVTADALLPFRCPAMTRAPDDPQPLPYLDDEADRGRGGLNIDLSVLLQTAKMRETGAGPVTLAHTNSNYLYWTPAQMVAHHASSGCNMRPGDLIGTGTLSGPQKSQSGSLLELSSGGRDFSCFRTVKRARACSTAMKSSSAASVVAMVSYRSASGTAAAEFFQHCNDRDISPSFARLYVCRITLIATLLLGVSPSPA